MADAVKPKRATGARDRLMQAALELFLERGYDAVPTEEILARAGVSRGAMYHHFPGKIDLFRAVFEGVERRNIARIAGVAASAASTPFAQLEAACRTYLEQSETNLELQRIGLMQSRAVLGFENWRVVVRELGLGAWIGGVTAAIEAGEMIDVDPEFAAYMLSAVVIEGGLMIVTSPPEERTAARAHAEKVALALLSGLRR